MHQQILEKILEHNRLASEVATFIALREGSLGGLSLAEVDALIKEMYRQYAHANADLLLAVRDQVSAATAVQPPAPVVVIPALP